MLLNCSVGEDSWESLGLQGDPSSPSQRKSVLNITWKDWCWSWNSNTLATSCEELTHLKRPWCWERLKAGGEGDDRGWGGWMASLTQWTWVWVNSWSWWWTGRPGVLQFMGSQKVGHDWVTELSWTVMNCNIIALQSLDLFTPWTLVIHILNWEGGLETGGLLLDPLNKRFMHHISILRQLGWSFFFFYGLIENSQQYSNYYVIH